MKIRSYLAVAALLSAALSVPVGAASAGTCGEVGIYGKATNSAGALQPSYIAFSTIYTTYIPPAATCTEDDGSMTVNHFATNHNSMHLRSGNACVEIVAQRFNDGHLTVYGYNCGLDPSVGGGQNGAVTNLDFTGYRSTTMLPYAALNADGGWDLEVYSYDENRYIYLATVTGSNVNKPLYPFAESSGYNAQSQRNSAWSNYRISRTKGLAAWEDVYVGCVDRSGDPQQHVRPGYGAAGIFIGAAVSGAGTC